jgi:hypothetical protein
MGASRYDRCICDALYAYMPTYNAYVLSHNLHVLGHGAVAIPTGPALHAASVVSLIMHLRGNRHAFPFSTRKSAVGHICECSRTSISAQQLLSGTFQYKLTSPAIAPPWLPGKLLSSKMNVVFWASLFQDSCILNSSSRVSGSDFVSSNNSGS